MTVATSNFGVHTAHVALLGGWLVILAVAWVWQLLKGRQRSSQACRSGDERPLAVRATVWPAMIAACSIVAGSVHLSIIAAHFRESALHGSFFLALTASQFAFAAWVLIRPTRALLTAGALASAGVVLLWIATRTIGIPIGPAAGETEPVGALDVTASMAELALVVACLAALHNSVRVPYGTRRNKSGAEVTP
jgi:hypothetical protein